MPAWPASLPQRPLLDGYSESPQTQVVSTSMDSGPPKSRRRFTAATTQIDVQYLLTDAQIATFKEFFKTDIQAGSLPFDWTKPRTGQVVSVMIAGENPYSATLVSTGLWRLVMTLEQMP